VAGCFGRQRHVTTKLLAQPDCVSVPPFRRADGRCKGALHRLAPKVAVSMLRKATCGAKSAASADSVPLPVRPFATTHSFPDIRNDYQRSEVAMDFNAGFTGAAAGLVRFDHSRKTRTCSNSGTGVRLQQQAAPSVVYIQDAIGARPIAVLRRACCECLMLCCAVLCCVSLCQVPQPARRSRTTHSVVGRVTPALQSSTGSVWMAHGQVGVQASKLSAGFRLLALNMSCAAAAAAAAVKGGAPSEKECGVSGSLRGSHV
jgi:hypothetical protein